MARATIDRSAVHRIIDTNVPTGVEAAARFMADKQRQTAQSRRLRFGVTHESGRDARGWFARAGMSHGERGTQYSPWFFWYYHEYQTGMGPPGRPFIRPSLWNNTRTISRLLTGGRA
jgi:hypothetical protein